MLVDVFSWDDKVRIRFIGGFWLVGLVFIILFLVNFILFMCVLFMCFLERVVFVVFVLYFGLCLCLCFLYVVFVGLDWFFNFFWFWFCFGVWFWLGVEIEEYFLYGGFIVIFILSVLFIFYFLSLFVFFVSVKRVFELVCLRGGDVEVDILGVEVDVGVEVEDGVRLVLVFNWEDMLVVVFLFIFRCVFLLDFGFELEFGYDFYVFFIEFIVLLFFEGLLIEIGLVVWFVLGINLSFLDFSKKFIIFLLDVVFLVCRFFLVIFVFNIEFVKGLIFLFWRWFFVVSVLLWVLNWVKLIVWCWEEDGGIVGLGLGVSMGLEEIEGVSDMGVEGVVDWEVDVVVRDKEEMVFLRLMLFRGYFEYFFFWVFWWVVNWVNLVRRVVVGLCWELEGNLSVVVLNLGVNVNIFWNFCFYNVWLVIILYEEDGNWIYRYVIWEVNYENCINYFFF